MRIAYPAVPESADFVMYWWHKAADAVRHGAAERFGLITTNSLTMIFNRRVVEMHQAAKPPLSLAFAVPDHPWVDSAGGAAVRIAMTIGVRGAGEGRLLSVAHESEADGGEVAVQLVERHGIIHADLKVGANLTNASKLRANQGLSHMGVILVGSGFVVEASDPLRQLEPAAIKPYLNGRDLTQKTRGHYIIDLAGMSEAQVREQFPHCYQRLVDRVRPERVLSQDKYLRENWWLFRRTNMQLRTGLAGLTRYIGTTETSKHRTFSFIEGAVLPDQKIRVVTVDDALVLGVLSSATHVRWALAVGGTLEDRPVYNNTACFEPFPFPADDTGLTPELADRIRRLAEQLDAHRKARQAAHSDVTLTAMYNVLEKLRSGEPLSAKDKLVHEHALVSVLQSLHDELDAAVLSAYGWADLRLPADTDMLLERLVALNAHRAAEEAAGTVRRLRPAFQQRAGEQTAFAPEPDDEGVADTAESTTAQASSAAVPPPLAVRAWPSGLPEQIKAVAEVMAQAGRPLDLAALAAHFQARGRWRDRLPMLLDTLVALGRLRQADGGRWGDAGR